MGGNATFRIGVGCNANFHVFRYQHVCIPNKKLWLWGSKPARGPNVNGFASQWNIGLIIPKKSKHAKRTVSKHQSMHTEESETK